jgi:RNA polymerase sigma-70 factor (ECF subfamily)
MQVLPAGDAALDGVGVVIRFATAGRGPRARGGRATGSSLIADERRIAGGTANPEARRTTPSADALVRARRGDADAFGELVRHFEPDVARLCRRILGATEEARDAAQESFARAHAALDGYDPERPFRPWLLGIAAHRAIDALRRRRREARLFAGEDLDAAGHADASPSPLQHGLFAERRRELLAAIDALPDPYRAALTLRYYADLEFDTISEILAVSRNQVATLLFRGRKRLRDALQEDEP